MKKQVLTLLTNTTRRDKLINSIAGLFIFTLITVLIWASNKGFEFSDESYYSIGFLFGIETDNTVIYFHKIYHFLLGSFNLNLSQNRIIGILLSLTSSVFLANEAIKYFSIKNKLLLFLTTSIFGLMHYTIYPMAISYNSLSSVFVTLLIGLSLNYLSTKKNYIFFIIGSLSFLLIINKFTNIVFLVFLLSLLLILNKNELKLKKLFLNTLLYLLGIIVTLFLLFPSIQDIRYSYINFVYGLSLSTGHGISDMILKNYNDLKSVLVFTVYLLPLVTTLIIIRLNVFNKKLIIKYQTIFISLIITSTFIYLFISKSYLTGFYTIFALQLLFLLSALIIIIFYKKNKETTKELSYASLFILIPFVSALGTNNSLFLQYTFYGSSFGLGLFLALNNIPKNLIKQSLFLLILFITTLQISFNKVRNPYRLKPLTDQTEKIQGIKYLSHLKVDPATKEVIEELKELKNHPAKKVFLCSDQLGISIITNKPPLFFSWIDKSSYHLISEYLLNKKEELNQNILFFIPSEIEEKAMVISELTTSKELNFLASYKYMKTVIINGTTLEIHEKK